MPAVAAERIPTLLLAAPVALLIGGCASTGIQAQWADPEFANHSLQGATVLVRCAAKETAVQRVCVDRLSEQVRAAGAVPVPATGADTATGSGAQVDAATMTAARSAGAKAILTSTIALEAIVASPRPTIGIGMGSYGGSVGTGVGVSVPVGGQGVSNAYAADMVLTDVASERVMWTSRVTAPASKDVGAQLEKLAKTGVDSAKAAGVF